MLALDAAVHRVTLDMDYSLRAGPAMSVTDILRQVCSVQPSRQDGMSYQLVTEGKDAPRILREESHNPTIRAKLVATLHCQRPNERRFAVDVTVAEMPFEPAMREWQPTIRGFEPMLVPAYPWELVLAEKVHAVLTGSFENPRLRDYMDIIAITRADVADPGAAAEAIRRVFEARGSAGRQHAKSPVGLSPEFAAVRQRDWTGTLARTGYAGVMPQTLADAIEEVRGIVEPLLVVPERVRGPQI